MTVNAIQQNVPYFIFNTSDVVDGKVSGIGHKGARAYNLDLKIWYIVNDDLTLSPLLDSSVGIQDSLGSQLRISGDGEAWVRAREQAREASGEIFLLLNPADGETVTINDGVHDAVVFEFDSNETVTGDNVSVLIGATPAATIATLIPLINAATDLNITATSGGVGASFCTLVNENVGEIGNVAITTTSVNLTPTGMSDGLDEVSLRTLQETPVEMTPDSKLGQIKHVQVQFSATPGTVFQLTNLPTWAKYIKIYPQSGTVAFAFGENPAIDAADAGTTNAINFGTNASIGGIAVSGQFESRQPIFGATVRMVSDTANAKAWIEISSGD
jgi:hypothetical protein